MTEAQRKANAAAKAAADRARAKAKAEADAREKARAEANAEAQRRARARAEEQKAEQAEAAARAAKEAKARADASEAERVKREKDKAAADKAKDKIDDPTAYKNNIDIFKAYLSLINIDVAAEENQGWIQELFNIAKPQMDAGVDQSIIPDLILKSGKAPTQFASRFSAMLKANKDALEGGFEAPYSSISNYITAENEYRSRLLSVPEFKKYAKTDSIKKFIEGGNSIGEVEDRINNALFAVKGADAGLKEQIKKFFPAANDEDLADALLTGTTDALTQRQRFGQAEILTEAVTAGINLASDVSELQKRGVTRATAAKGLKQVASEKAGIQQAARMFGQAAPSQLELEQEALNLGDSDSANRLRSQARAQFAGQSGVTTGSLSRKKQV
jgi:hypothetical protein